MFRHHKCALLCCACLMCAPPAQGASTGAAPNIPRWATTYGWTMAPDESGAQPYTNMAWGNNLDHLDWAWGNHSQPGMWDFNGGTGGCVPNKTRVIGEPYCGGATGLMVGWQIGVQWVVDTIKERKHIVGLSLGDEPEIQGVPYSQMCELSTFLKARLLAAGRGDVPTPCNASLSLSLSLFLCLSASLCLSVLHTCWLDWSRYLSTTTMVPHLAT